MIGAGKSTATDICEDFGLAVINADKIGKQVVDDDPEVIQKLAKKFGDDILTPKGNLRRKKLAEKAFRHERTRRQLNQIVHPSLLREIKKQTRQYKREKKDIVIDAALLLEWGIDKTCDHVLMIHASEKARLARLYKRGITINDALARQKQQLSFKQFRDRSDYMILNNDSVEVLKKKLVKLLQQLGYL